MYAQEQNPWNGNMWLTGGKVLGNWGYHSPSGTNKVRRWLGARCAQACHPSPLPPLLLTAFSPLCSTTVSGKPSVGPAGPTTRT